ncbi:MAG: hypothetical protein FK734_11370, partial [Asgard group archaeon]|nr:hypothetical protein [Asgard group archaeon]
PNCLRIALDKIQQRHPLLGVTIILDEQGKPWFTSEGVGSIPLNIITQNNDEHKIQIVEHELSTIFVMGHIESIALPLMRVTFLKDDSADVKRNNIIFCTQHIIADGLSMIFLISDLLQYMEIPNEPVIVLDGLANTVDLLPPKIRRKIPKNKFKFNILYNYLKFRHWLKFSNLRKTLARNGKVKGDMETKSTQSSFKLFSWKLNQTQTSNLLEKCKHEHVSVQAAICTAFLPNFPTINSTVNIRARFPQSVGESFGFLAGNTIIGMKYNKKITFWKNVKKYHRKLILHLHDKNIFLQYKVFSKMVSRAKIQDLGKIYADLKGFFLPITITNMGSLDRFDVSLTKGILSVKDFFGSVSGIGLVLLVFTINQEMHFHLNYVDANITQEVANVWIQDAIKLLSMDSS